METNPAIATAPDDVGEPGSPFRPATSRLTLIVVAFVAASLVLGGAVFAALTVRDRETTLDAAAQTLAELVTLMEEQVGSAIETDGVVLSRMEDLIQRHGMAALSSNPSHQATLRRIMADAPAIQSLLIIAPDGNLALASQDVAPGDNGFRGDRDYFVSVMPPAARGDFVSPLIRERMTGAFVFALSRRVEDRSGQVLAVVQSSIAIDHFLRLYRRLSLDPAQTFAVYKADGALVMRHPLPALENVRATGNAPFVHLSQSRPAGTYVSPSVIDGIDRLHAYRSMPERGLIITSSLPLSSVLDGWRRRAWQNGAMMLGVLLVEMVLAYYAVAAAARADAARRQMIAAHRSKSTFFASVSHDLRQPLQAMRLFWSVIEQQAAATDDILHRQAIAKLGTALDASEELLNSLLDVATLEAGGIIPRLCSFDLQDIIDTEAGSFGKLAETRGLRVRVVTAHVMVYSDPVLLRRILRNLLVNAIKYTDRGGILVGSRRRGRSVLLQVWDSGKGIAADRIEAIFDDFYQIENSSRSHSEGLGLGLSVVSRTARLLGHEVRVRSRPGFGSVFEVELRAG